MKKNLLLVLAALACHTVSGQNRRAINAVHGQQAIKAERISAETNSELPSFGPVQAAPSTTVQYAPVTRMLAPTITETLIGQTIYDLQSNQASPRRITNNGNGTYSAVWTTVQPGGTTGANRGTGYSYYNGTSWTTPIVNTRIESVRTGFTCISTSNGTEYVTAHTATDVALTKRTSLGSGTWSTSTVGTPNLFAGQTDTWARSAVAGSNGTTVHVISHGKGVQTNVYPLGMDGPLTYSRSLDGGVTWDIDHIQLPDCDSSYFLGFGGESYNIDARGDNVAIVGGGLDADLALWKSTDNGSTWTRTTIFAFPMGPLYNDTNTTGGANIIDIDGDGLNDTIVVPANDPTVSIDGNGMAHVAVGGNLILDDDAPGRIGLFFVDVGILYWNESRPMWDLSNGPNYIENSVVARAIDYNGDGDINLPTVASGQIPYGGYGTYSESCQPSIGFDADNNIYLAYASINEEADTTAYPAAHRHVYITRSGPGGFNFGAPVNIMPDPTVGAGSGEYLEGVWPSIARDVEGTGTAACAHIVYQQDEAPYYSSFGAPLTTNPAWVGVQQAWNADQNNNPNISSIVAVKVCDIPTGINAVNSNISELLISPNPAKGIVAFQIGLNKSEEMQLGLMDIAGRTVLAKNLGMLNSGTTTQYLSVSGLRAGIYIYQLKSEKGIKSGKLVIE